MRRELRRSTAEVRFNTAFADVIRACAGPRRYEQGTWITDDMIDAYRAPASSRLGAFDRSLAGRPLIGGLYGLIIGRAVFGESMFSLRSNASKIALLVLDRMLSRRLSASSIARCNPAIC